MRNRWLVLVLAVLVVGGLVGSAAAGGWGTKVPRFQSQKFVGKGGVGKHTFAPRRTLGLTAEQKEKIANLKRTLEEGRLTFQENTSELRSELARKKLEMQELLLAESPELSKVNDLVDEMASIQAEIQKKAIEFRLKVKSLVTKEDLEKLRGPGLEWGFGGPMGHSRTMAGTMGGPMGHSRTMVPGGCWR